MAETYKAMKADLDRVSVTRAIAIAVKAEREACAKLAMTATETGNKYPMTASDQLRLDIAAAIRARKDKHV